MLKMMTVFWNIIILSFAHQLAKVEGAYSATNATAIRTLIFTTNSYDYVSRPTAQTNIKVSLAMLAIEDLDMQAQSMKGVGWFTLEWDDSRLTWTPSSYGDIQEIFQVPTKIWKPELVVDNSVDEIGVITDANLYLRINYLGKVEWEPPKLFEVHCEADITYYPYDQQKCAIDIISWGYTVDEVLLEAASSGIYLNDFEDNGEWKVTKSSVEYNNVTEVTSSGTTKVHPQLRFFIHMQRRTSFYNLNVMIPTLITSMLVVLVFIVPDESGEKLSYVLTVFLSIAVLLTLIADSLPPTSITVSVLGLYLALVLILSGLAILFTVGIMIVAKRDGYVAESSWLYKLIHFAARVTRHSYGLRAFSRTSGKIAPSQDNETDKETKIDIPFLHIEWKEASQILDKFCFCIFLIVCIAMNFSFVVALTVGGSVNDPD